MPLIILAIAPAIQEQMNDVIEKLNEKLVSSTASASSPSRRGASPLGETKPIPKDIYSAAAIVAKDGAQSILPADDFSEALVKYAYAMEKLSIFKSELNDSVQMKFVLPMKDIMDVLFVQAAESRKILSQMRLTMDSVKSRCKSASSEKMGNLQHELDAAESDYTNAMTDASRRLKAVVDNPLVVQYVADLVESQRKFHKQSYEILNGVIIV